jgi:GNAT superfamily N-acetyltransferase
MTTHYELRQLTVDDAPGGVVLAKSVGWHQDVNNWEQMIRWAGEGALGITCGDQLVASSFALEYSRTLAWIGLVITHSEHQQRGLARRIMAATLDHLRARQIESIMLDASGMGFPIYEKLGFQTLYKVEVWEGDIANPPAVSSAQPLTESDIPAVIALDAQNMGVVRPQVIQARANTAWVDKQSGEVDGYLLARVVDHSVQVGPWYHRLKEGAEHLLQTAMARFNGYAVRFNIPETNLHAKAMVERYGLRQGRYCTRMILEGTPPGQMDRQYSCNSFATG